MIGPSKVFAAVRPRRRNSAETIVELEARGLLYVLGLRERTDRLVREFVLDDAIDWVHHLILGLVVNDLS